VGLEDRAIASSPGLVSTDRTMDGVQDESIGAKPHRAIDTSSPYGH
jgi:hypothetical protein